MNIGKIIKSDSHVNYKCRIYGKREIPIDITEKDYHFGQFVKVKLFDDKHVVGVIYNSQLINPDYGNFGPRLTNPSSNNFVTIPDFIDETAVVLDILMLGWTESSKSIQGIPLWVIPLNTEVSVMEVDEVIRFHTDASGNVCFKYYNQIIAHTDNFASQLLINIINFLIQRFDNSQQQKLKLLQEHILWQQTNVCVK